MYAPFKKRATEYLGDGAPFLAVVTADFYEALLKPRADSGELFDRVVEIIGTPGSGKTTLAKLVQYQNAQIVAGNPKEYPSLFSALLACRILDDETSAPAVLAARLPLESEYRNFWELPYSEAMRNDMLYMFVQARAVLAWLRQLESAGVQITSLKIETSTDSPAQAEAIGSADPVVLKQRAIQVERVLYNAVASIVPADLETVTKGLGGPYAPFESLCSFIIDGKPVKPLIILDDFHLLHSEQRRAMYRNLTRRELRISRWLMTRLDALHPSQAIARTDLLGNAVETIPSDVSIPREVVQIRMQDEDGWLRKEFQQAARLMADRYLQQHALLRRSGRLRLGQALATGAIPIGQTALREIKASNQQFTESRQISPQRLNELRGMVTSAIDEGEPDVRELALHILLERYVRRVPQAALLADFDPEPSRPVSCDPEVIDGARIQLMHKYRRPYYGGLDTVIAAASGNTEQFLLLCDPLVDALAAQLIRRRRDQERLTLDVQHKLLQTAAEKQVNSWVFPHNQSVRKLTDFIGNICVTRAMLPTAPLGSGPNAIGIEQERFLSMLRNPARANLAQTIKFGVAYNALNIRWGVQAKNKTWALLHLHGVLCIFYGLSLKRGNFIDTVSIADLESKITA